MLTDPQSQIPLCHVTSHTFERFTVNSFQRSGTEQLTDPTVLTTKHGFDSPVCSTDESDQLLLLCYSLDCLDGVIGSFKLALYEQSTVSVFDL